jgi:SEC-C motif-containing protein
MTDCPCGSRRAFSACCQPCLAGEPAPTAEALMRSRYSAYVLGNFDHIERSCTGPAAVAFNRAEAERSQLGTLWLGLNVLKTHKGRETDSEGTVTFEFRYRQNGQDHAQRDVSSFRRIDGAWFYHDSDLSQTPSSLQAARVGRNDPCPCGSGMKYKKCHGA